MAAHSFVTISATAAEDARILARWLADKPADAEYAIVLFAYLDALRAVAEAARPFAERAGELDRQCDERGLPRRRDDAELSGFALGPCRAVRAALDKVREAGG